MLRLMAFRRPTCPSTGPFDHFSDIAACTAAASTRRLVARDFKSASPEATAFTNHSARLVFDCDCDTQAFFQGSIYRMINAIISVAAYVVFAVWPAAGRALYGWFFGLW